MRPWLSLLLLLFLCGLTGAWSVAGRGLTVVQWSDIHSGNEEYRPHAWDQAWREGLALHPDILVMSGDQVDNKCSPAAFDKREDDYLPGLAQRLQQGHVPAVLAVGNNDLSANYQTDPAVLSDTIGHYRKYFGSRCYLDSLGNGVLPQQVGGWRWLSINSVIFSAYNRYSGRESQANSTLTWLSAHLGEREPVVLVMHIPPAREIAEDKEAWSLPVLRRFAAVLDRHAGPICILSGHFHRNEIHALKLPSGRLVPVLVAGSLSGKFGAVPNWRSYRWDGDNIQYTIRYPGHTPWTTHYALSHPATAASYQQFTTLPHYDDDFFAHNPLSMFSLMLRSNLESEIIELK